MGVCLLQDPKRNTLFMLNHIEYETDSLREEFLRDQRTNPNCPLPLNYFEKNDPKLKPQNRWRSHAHLLFGNWINQIYQETPFNLESIGGKKLKSD